MATLTFIGLVNYKPSTNNLINIIFTSNKDDKTTYQYNFSNTPVLVNTITTWSNIPTLTNVTIPANTEITAQLNRGIIAGSYTLYIRELKGTVTSANTIWQTSTTSPIYVPPVVLPSTLETDIINYTNNLSSYTTTTGGSINNITFLPIGTDAQITSNIIYRSSVVTINITTAPDYNGDNPLFIMSNSTITLKGTLKTTSTGSINIVGTGSTGVDGETGGIGISIAAEISITGNVSLHGSGGTGGLNGTGGRGISIAVRIIITGNVILHGTGGTGGGEGDVGNVGVGGDGIVIEATITNSSTSNVILHGMGGVGGATDFGGNGGLAGIGIVIGAEIIITGNVILHGTGGKGGTGVFSGDGSDGIVISAEIIITGNVILHGTGGTGGGKVNEDDEGGGNGGDGIIIEAAITNISTSNIILHGMGGDGGNSGNTGGLGGRGIVIGAEIIITGNVTLPGTGGTGGTARTGGRGGIGIVIDSNISITNNVILHGMGGDGVASGVGGGGGNGIVIEATITNSSTSNVILHGTGGDGKNSSFIQLGGFGGVAGIGIVIGTEIIITGNVILHGTGGSGGTGRQGGRGINISASIIITGTLTLEGGGGKGGDSNPGVVIGGTGGRGISISTAITNNSTGNVSLRGMGGDGIVGGIGISISTAIRNNSTGNVVLHGTSGAGGLGISISATVTITSNVFFIITITNSTLPYIRRESGTITGLINIIIDPSSTLSIPGYYNLFVNIPAINIGTMTGLFNNITWKIISTLVNNWVLVTIASKFDGSISGSNIVIGDKYYILSPSGNIIFKYILKDVTSILETQSILVTSSKNGTIIYISDDNIVKVIATGLYGITSIMQDNNKNIYYTIIAQKLFFIYKLGTNGNANKLLLQGQGENINIFYSFVNIIVVNTDTNIISIYKFLYDIKLEFIYKKDVSNLGIITNIINNNGTLLFLFNNNTIYKFNTINMINIYFTNTSYVGIALTNNTLYGIINNGGIPYSEKLLSGYLLTNN